jgi:HK97 gp10 family phage protein
MGTAKLIKQLNDIGKSLDKPENEMAGAIFIVDRAQELAPVRTGFLKENIVATQEGTNVAVEAQAPYSGYVEYGTSKQPAQPFLRPAVDEYKHQIAQEVGKEIERNIRKAV